MTRTSERPGRGAVPAHVAWVGRPAGRGHGSAEHSRASAVPGAPAHPGDGPLPALVDAALELGVRWLTVQVPPGVASLSARAGALAERAVAVCVVPASSSSGPVAPRDLVEVASPRLRVLVAEERSGRAELVGAVRELAARGVRPKDVTEAVLSDVLGVPDVDLLVLTGNDRRVPDLLVWQVAYCEIVVLEDRWSETGAAQLHAAVAEYQRRDRRYGGLVTSR